MVEAIGSDATEFHGIFVMNLIGLDLKVCLAKRKGTSFSPEAELKIDENMHLLSLVFYHDHCFIFLVLQYQPYNHHYLS